MKYRVYYFLLIGFVFYLGGAGSVLAQDANQSVLTLGLLPYLTPKVLLRRYTPVVRYLEERLQQKVVVKTAPDFRAYLQRCIDNEYDIYLTAPHFAAYLEKKYGHRILAGHSVGLTGTFAVTVNSPYHNLQDLRGKILATPDQLAITSLLGEVTLEQNGLVIGKDIKVMRSTSHNNALHLVLNGLADVAVVGNVTYRITNKKYNYPLKVLAKTIRIPTIMFMASSHIAKERSAQLKSIMLDFTAAGAGKKFFTDTPFKDMKEVTQEDIKKLEPFLPLLEARLK